AGPDNSGPQAPPTACGGGAGCSRKTGTARTAESERLSSDRRSRRKAAADHPLLALLALTARSCAVYSFRHTALPVTGRRLRIAWDCGQFRPAPPARLAPVDG